MFIIDVV